MHEVHHAGAERILRETGRMLKKEMPPGFGFALFIFSYGEDGEMFYASSEDRANMLNALKEFIANQESLTK